MSGLSRKAPNKRPYNNALREEQAQETRNRILDGVARELLEGSLQDLSVSAVAERTGVSAATIYRHFPNREALLDAVDQRLARDLNRPRMPETVEDLEAGAPAMFRYYEDNLQKLRIASSAEALQKLRAHTQIARDRFMQQILAPETAHLEERRANAVHALLRGMFSFDTYARMQDRFGVDAEMASEIVGWATRALLSELEDERAREGVAEDSPAPPRRRRGGKR